MIDPTYFIAPFALLYAFYIIIVYVAIYARKKILEEGRNWRGVPMFLGGIAFFVVIGIIYFGIFTFYYLFFAAYIILPILIIVPLVIAYKANSKIERKDVVGYQVIHKKMSWSETVGIIGPVLVLIGCAILFFESFLYIFWGWYGIGYLSPLFTWFCSLIGFAGVILGVKGRSYGRFFCFLAGVLAIAGRFIPIQEWTVLTFSYFFFEPFLLGIGGILCVISQNDFFMYYLKGRELHEEFINIEVEIDKIDDLKLFLQEKLGSDWDKIKISLEAYQAGELDKNTFITTAVKNIGNKFIDIFKERKRGKLNDL